MNAKKIALALVAISIAASPVAANAAAKAAKPGGYFGYTTTGVRHWIPDPAARTKKWFEKWLERERKQGREYDFDSQG